MTEEVAALQAQVEQLTRELAEERRRFEMLSLFRLPVMTVKVDPTVTCDPAQRKRVLDYHDRRWAQLVTLSGDALKDAATRFVLVIRSGVESRVISMAEAEAWMVRVQELLTRG